MDIGERSMLGQSRATSYNEGPPQESVQGNSRVWYAMTLQFDEAGRDRGQNPPTTPFSMNRWYVPPASQGGAGKGSDPNVVMPPVDVRFGKEEITLVAQMPGIPGENIDIRVLPSYIQIIGLPPDEAGWVDDYKTIESRLPESRRGRRFTGAVPPRGARANLKDGVLELRLPRSMLLHGRTRSRIPVR